MTDTPLTSDELDSLVGALTLERKVQLLTGRDFWSTVPLEEIGLRAMVLSDGPAGVRGELWDERYPSLSLPSGTALASSWDDDIAREYGRIMAQEARRQGVDIVLGPTINLHRSPLGGRHFEAFSEDPLLTARLAAAYVDGMQSQGVAATPKHYVANDYETDRMTASSDVDDRALRELYLAAFEKAVVDSRTWVIMSAYNAVNGVSASESALLTDPLVSEWGFDGVVVSDWGGVYRLDAAESGQTLAMPGPTGAWGDALVEAVRAGTIAESLVDDKVRRMLLLAARVGALEGFEPRPLAAHIDGPAFARKAAVEGSVLVANDGILPLDPGAPSRIAVVGQSAELARTQGGGSATVQTTPVVTPATAVRDAFPGAQIDYAIGALLDEGIIPLSVDEIVNPATGASGALVRFLDADGVELAREDRLATELFYFGGTAPTGTAATYELSFRWTPTESVDRLLSYAVGATSTLSIDGVDVASTSDQGLTFDQILHSPPEASVPVTIGAGETREVVVHVDLASRPVPPTAAALFSLKLGTQPVSVDRDALIDEAVTTATGADVAIVVVGTSNAFESEGWDRSTVDLPGEQNRLVEAVLDTGVPTIVIVNAGAPVLLPWHDRAAAILVTYFGGQEMGPAIADILTGVAEPGGRLPTTWAERADEIPVLDTTPRDGHVAYAEGIYIGYRGWLRSGLTPAWPFGHGLGYTSWAIGEIVAPTRLDAENENSVSVHVENTGDRAGKQVVQLYVTPSGDAEWPIDRPERWLVGSAVARLDAHQSVELELPIDRRAFAAWIDGAWVDLAGDYELLVGMSVLDIARTHTITVTGARA